jgi:biotin transport system substrate-specific component
MTQNNALVPFLLAESGNRISHNILSIAGGVLLISLLAQIAIPLPFSPVPITGQTFGVALTSLLWGRKRAVTVLISYFLLGALGLPVFALGKSGFSLGPTSGYLIGMLIASFWMGFLADSAWTKTFGRTWIAAFSGSVIIFSFGLLGLSFFLPQSEILSAGLLPFLPGDAIKTLLARSIAYNSTQKLEIQK